jgi:hypothetical protein
MHGFHGEDTFALMPPEECKISAFRFQAMINEGILLSRSPAFNRKIRLPLCIAQHQSYSKFEYQVASKHCPKPDNCQFETINFSIYLHERVCSQTDYERIKKSAHTSPLTRPIVFRNGTRFSSSLFENFQLKKRIKVPFFLSCF